MSNPFQHPRMQHLLTCLGAVGASVVAPAYLPEGSMVAGALGAVGGVAGNLLSIFVQKFCDRREADPTRPDVNNDLLRLVGNAVAGEVAALARETSSLPAPERKRVEAFAGKIAEAFFDLMHNADLPDLAPPDVKRLLTAAHHTALPPVGEVEDWQEIVHRLNRRCQAGLERTTEDAIAQRLQTQLWETIRGELKKDFAAQGRAYAALHLSFMSEVLATLDTLSKLPQEHTHLTRELLEELRARKAESADPQIQTLLAKLAREAPERVAAFAQRFDRLDAQFDQVLGKLDVMEASAERRHGEVMTTLHATRTEESVQDRQVLDAILAKLDNQERLIGELRTQLEASIRRAERAEASGDQAAGAALESLRDEGDLKPMETFLEQQAADQPSDVGLLREQAAVAYVSGEIARAEQCLQQILAALPDDLDAINRLGHIYQLRGDLNAAERQYRRVLDLTSDDHSWQARALGNLGNIARTRGQLDEAERLYRDALTIEQQLGHLEGQAAQLGNLGLIAQTRGQLDEAERLHRDALTINQQLGHLEGQAIQLANLGLVAKEKGKIAEARRLWTEARDLYARVGAKPMQERVQGWLGGLPPK